MPKKLEPNVKKNETKDESTILVCRACGGTGKSSRGRDCICTSYSYRLLYYPNGLPSNCSQKEKK